MISLLGISLLGERTVDEGFEIGAEPLLREAFRIGDAGGGAESAGVLLECLDGCGNRRHRLLLEEQAGRIGSVGPDDRLGETASPIGDDGRPGGLRLDGGYAEIFGPGEEVGGRPREQLAHGPI